MQRTPNMGMPLGNGVRQTAKWKSIASAIPTRRAARRLGTRLRGVESSVQGVQLEPTRVGGGTLRGADGSQCPQDARRREGTPQLVKSDRRHGLGPLALVQGLDRAIRRRGYFASRVAG